jgi:hypothetical protein
MTNRERRDPALTEQLRRVPRSKLSPPRRALILVRTLTIREAAASGIAS